MPSINVGAKLTHPREQALARAIHRASLRHWLTTEHLLDHFLKQPLTSMEPMLQGVLLAGGSQLVFMHGQPAFAVVNETVELARRLIRPGAAKLANAVLRKLSSLVVKHTKEAWQPAVDRLPIEGGFVQFSQPLLPDPADLPHHLAIATSHPPRLLQRWLDVYGPKQTEATALHSLCEPPTIITPCPPVEAVALPVTAHDAANAANWTGSYDQLVEWLAADPRRRVQDPTAAAAVEATAGLSITNALDLCAGLGTKTRQLALLHPHARITTTDPSPQSMAKLRELAEQLDQVEAVDTSSQLPERKFGLVVADVPCSNTGVLARRLEARYRFSAASLKSVVELQQQIIQRAVKLVASGGYVLYATCSIEPQENQQQVKYLLDQVGGGEVVSTALTLPDGAGSSYCDGGFFALVRCL